LKPFTRDTYGIAIKATYVEVNGKPIEVFKNPKTDTGNFKKSQKGMCYVHYDENGEIVVTDGYTRETLPKEGNLLVTVFKDGKVYNEVSIYDVRNTLHNNKF
jgi:nicotinamide phosphoribosyltransferase